MFLMVPYKNNSLIDAEVKLTLVMVVEENGRLFNRFYPMDLELSRLNAFSLSWTIVHPINGRSPLYSLTEEDVKNYKAEIMVIVKAFDDTFSNTVVAKSSYTYYEIIWGAKFIPMFHRSPDGNHTILELEKLSEHVKVDISEAFKKHEVQSPADHSQNLTG